MKFEELKTLIIEHTSKALGKDSPENWDYLTEEYIMSDAIEEDDSLLEGDEEGAAAVTYGHDAYLNHSDNKWHYKRNKNDSGPSGGCGSDKRKWRCSAKRVGFCSKNDIKFKFYN